MGGVRPIILPRTPHWLAGSTAWSAATCINSYFPLGFFIYDMDISQAFPAGNPSRYKSQKRPRPKSMEIISETPVSQTVREVTRIGNKRRRNNPYRAIHRFKRTLDAGQTIVCDGVNNTYLAVNFSMNDMPGYTELASLYDFYKLTGVKYTAIPYKQDSASLAVSASNTFNPPIFYTIDRNDSSTPTTISEILEYNDHKISSVWKGFSIYIKDPKFSDATSAQRGGWVATTNPSLNWFGLKLAIPPTNFATTFYSVVTFYVACKDPK